jgi:hypothetical protein
LQKASRLGVPAEAVDAELDALGITVSLFGRLDARLAASFYRYRSGRGLAGRVCLGLARSLFSPAYATARLGQHRAEDQWDRPLKLIGLSCPVCGFTRPTAQRPPILPPLYAGAPARPKRRTNPQHVPTPMKSLFLR